MLCHFNKFSRICAALVLGAAGIFGLIDQTSMIVLVIVLCIVPNSSCGPAARKA